MHLVLGSLLVTGLAGPAAAEVGRNTDVLNPNQASVEQLVELPHITEAIAKQLHDAIPFLGMTEVHKLLRTTLSDEQCAELYKQLFIPLNLNAATREEIMLVPGIGKKMAHEFEEYRPYEGMARFRREMGKYVDDDEVARLEQYVFVPIDLNTASDADILSIPGVGKRMLHEFKEYRPYKDIAQFRREIGKYVDEKELARLERYVTLGETAAVD
jgi:DNA uptake protein ComE-like DNA-binding protein